MLVGVHNFYGSVTDGLATNFTAGHPLLEVRSRSLRSIVFKLGNGLISYSELVDEKEFLAHLPDAVVQL